MIAVLVVDRPKRAASGAAVEAGEMNVPRRGHAGDEANPAAVAPSAIRSATSANASPARSAAPVASVTTTSDRQTTLTKAGASHNTGVVVTS